MELTPKQKEILARLKDLNAAQAVALAKQVTSYADFQEIEKREDEIIALHRELIESFKLTQNGELDNRAINVRWKGTSA